VHVLINTTSAGLSNATVSKPFSRNSPAMVEVSEKFSLQPSVLKDTVFNVYVFPLNKYAILMENILKYQPESQYPS